MQEISFIILGIVEGFSEFLPISSTFHLIATSRLLGLEQSNFLKFFLIFVQTGAILAVVFKYKFELFAKENIKNLALSFVPTSIVGFLLHKTIKNVFFEEYLTQVVIFILVGVAFLWFKNQNKDKKMTIREALLIGFFQSLAVMPGVSRAGAVMLGMGILGFSKSQSAKYSFMLAVPTIMAAGVLDLFKDRWYMQNNVNIFGVGLGLVVSFLVASFTIDWFIKFNEKYGLRIWGWYRIVLGGLILLFLR